MAGSIWGTPGNFITIPYTFIADIPALRNVSVADSQFVLVIKYQSAGDGGAFYYYDATDTTSADNGTTIVVTTAGARFKLFGFGPTLADTGSSLVNYANSGTPITVEEGLDLLYYGIANVENPKYAGGATPGGVVDSSAAIQAAIDSGTKYIYLPGLYRAQNLTLAADNLRFIGRTMDESGIITATDNIFNIEYGGFMYGLTMEHLTLTSEVGGGHIFNVVSGGVTNMSLRRLKLRQNNIDKCYWNQPQSGGYIDNKVELCWFYGRNANDHTVPLWNFVALGDVNDNTWERCRFTYSGNYVFQIDNQTSANWSRSNVWRDITWEVCNGGIARLYNCRGNSFEHCDTWDLSGATTRDLYVFDRSPTAGAGDCRDNSLTDCYRHGGTLGVGLVDVRHHTSSVTAPGLTLTRCKNVGGVNFAVDLGNRGALFIDCGAPAITNRGLLVTEINSDGIPSLSIGESTHATLTADVNDYDPSRQSWWRVSSDASRNITGIGGGRAGRVLKITNVGSFDIVFPHVSASSAATNRIICPGSAAFTLAAGETVNMIYDNTSQRWRIEYN